MSKIITLFILSLSLAASDVDYLKLTSILLKDGHYTRALQTLKKAKSNWDDIEEQKYYLLRGLYLLRTKKSKESILELNKVVASEYKIKKSSYLSEAYLHLGKNKQALEEIKKIIITKRTPKSIIYLYSKILFKNNNFQESIDILRPLKGYARAKKLLISHYLELSLYEQAFDSIKELVKVENTPLIYQRMAQLLHTHKMKKKLILLLEEGVIRFPHNVELIRILAATYNSIKYYRIAANLYTRLAYLDSSYQHLSAEYLKNKGMPRRATILNMMIERPAEKLTQRLAHLISEERYDLAYSLKTSLKKHNVLENDDVKYAMAYTYLLQGEYSNSIELLKKIKETRLIPKGLKLMGLIDECRKKKWECYGTL